MAHLRLFTGFVLLVFLFVTACDDETQPMPSVKVTLPGDLGETALVPGDWAFDLDSFGHFSFFVASSSKDVLSDLTIGGGGYRAIEEIDIEPEDAFVEVRVSYPPPSVDAPVPEPLPRAIDPSSFEDAGTMLEAPLYQLEGEGCNDGFYILRYWVGLEADEQLRDRTVAVLTSLDIGGAQGCPNGSGDTAIEGDPPRACAGHDARVIDFDGDEEADWVYLDWVKDGPSEHAEFGWCMGGRNGSMKTTGQAESLYVFDLYGDGRQEALFGGSTCCGHVVNVAVHEQGSVEVVELPNGKALDLMNGFWPAGERERWAVYGCEGLKDVAVTQVIATVQGENLLVRKTRYAIEGAVARMVGRDRYTIPDPGRESRGAHVSEAVGGCIEIFD